MGTRRYGYSQLPVETREESALLCLRPRPLSRDESREKSSRQRRKTRLFVNVSPSLLVASGFIFSLSLLCSKMCSTGKPKQRFLVARGHPRATRKKCGGAMHGRRHLLGVSKPAYSSRRKAPTSKGTATNHSISTRPRTGGQPCAATRPRRPRPAASRSAGARRSGRGPCSPPGCPTGRRWRPSGTTCVTSPPPFPRGAPCRSPR